jgi:hypothetical protein
MALDAVVKIRAGKRTYTATMPGALPSDSPTLAEKQATAAAALAAVVAAKGAGYSYTDAEPDWAAAVAVNITWAKTSNL